MTERIRPNDELPLSFLSCRSSREALRANLSAPACLGPSTVHQVIAVANCPSAADGRTVGLKRAKHDWVVQSLTLSYPWYPCNPWFNRLFHVGTRTRRPIP